MGCREGYDTYARQSIQIVRSVGTLASAYEEDYAPDPR